MAIKKSELYSSLWASCDELRGGMDASQYKDYVLVMLFIKYVSDKWSDEDFAPIEIPKGASFKDMSALKGAKDIGDQINKKIIAPLRDANTLPEMPDFNDETKLGDGKEMVDRLTNLIAIFENPSLDFSKNKADGDDILGDAYEYLMRHFATESGKSKGQFYTPAEVSRIMASIIGIHKANTSRNTTVYDPTCGSGSLLLKISSVAKVKPTLYGQEKDSATSALALMNMILHDCPTAEIKQGNTLSNPLFKDNNELKQFDYVVANPPFSDKKWSNGLTITDGGDDGYQRFGGFGIPPSKNGDFAYLLHIIRSLKSTGKGAIILPHGVLFRGNAEEAIRKNLITKGYIEGIIGLPANLFYGTGIPACIILIDKKDAQSRQSIFMIDAGKDFIKDGNKNRLREQDIRKITDVFNNKKIIKGYSDRIDLATIEDNNYNLNIPRYIDSQEKEDIQDINAHLNGGMPVTDIDDLDQYWKVFPSLRKELFSELRQNYSQLNISRENINAAIYENAEFTAFIAQMKTVFNEWSEGSNTKLRDLGKGSHPKAIIDILANDLLHTYHNQPLIDGYDIYQHLLSYWNEIMQDDVYIISCDGWQAETYRLLKETTTGKDKGKMKDIGWTCDLVPKQLVINQYFANEQSELHALENKLEETISNYQSLVEEHAGEEDALHEVNKKTDANEKYQEFQSLALSQYRPELFTKYEKATTQLKQDWRGIISGAHCKEKP